MADVNRGNRPLSPHLMIYRPQLTSISSILVRITGNALIVAGTLIVWWLFAAATSAEYFAMADAVHDQLVWETCDAGVDLGALVSHAGRCAPFDLGQRSGAGHPDRRKIGLGRRCRILCVNRDHRRSVVRGF